VALAEQLVAFAQ